MTCPRKGATYVPELDILIRDAFPLGSELTAPKTGKRAERRRDVARDLLIGMYRDAERRRAVDRLDWRVRDAIEDMKRFNGGRLPTRKGGRPEDKLDPIRPAPPGKSGAAARNPEPDPF